MEPVEKRRKNSDQRKLYVQVDLSAFVDGNMKIRLRRIS